MYLYIYTHIYVNVTIRIISAIQIDRTSGFHCEHSKVMG